MSAKFIFSLILSLSIALAVSAQPRKTAAAPPPPRTITVVSEPRADIWVDDVKYGATDEAGNLTLKNVPAGLRKMRVRASGFKEITQNLSAAQRGEVKIALVKTTDEAEIAFQEAEAATTADRQKAVELYRKAINLRPKFSEANVGLARVLLAQGDTEAALAAVKAARKARPVYPEAAAVEGRIYTTEDESERAIAAFKRALAEGKGFQPEAHTGLGLLYRGKAESAASASDFDGEKQNYVLAAAALKKAAAQLGGSPDAATIYQLLGDSYEEAKMYREAIKVYEEFLRLFPDADEASIVESFIVQAKKKLEEEQP